MTRLELGCRGARPRCRGGRSLPRCAPTVARRPGLQQWLEQACDEVNATLAPLRSFVIPGGTPAAAHLHVCRTVCRRAERRTIAVGEDVNPETVRYLNRLSDLLFILSRAANVASSPAESQEVEGEPGGGASGASSPPGEPLWDPGAHGSASGG